MHFEGQQALMGHQGTCLTSRNQCKVFQSFRDSCTWKAVKSVFYSVVTCLVKITLSCIISSSHHYLQWEPHDKKHRTKQECYKVKFSILISVLKKLHLVYHWVQEIKKTWQKLSLPLFLNLRTSEAWIIRLKCRSAFVPVKISSMGESGTQFILDQIRTNTSKNNLGFWVAEEPSIPRLSRCWCCNISEEEARLG